MNNEKNSRPRRRTLRLVEAYPPDVKQGAEDILDMLLLAPKAALQEYGLDSKKGVEQFRSKLLALLGLHTSRAAASVVGVKAVAILHACRSSATLRKSLPALQRLQVDGITLFELVRLTKAEEGRQYELLRDEIEDVERAREHRNRTSPASVALKAIAEDSDTGLKQLACSAKYRGMNRADVATDLSESRLWISARGTPGSYDTIYKKLRVWWPGESWDSRKVPDQ